MSQYFRNSELNANTWTRNQSSTTSFTSPFRYNQFGFNVGGPVLFQESSTATVKNGSFF